MSGGRESGSPLEIYRYLCRGTRWRRGQERVLDPCISGHLDGRGGQTSVAGLRSHLLSAADCAGLDELHRLVVEEYYGLSGYPRGLSEARVGLVGRVALRHGSSESASRATVAAVLAEAAAAVEAELAVTAGPAGRVLQPEVDPVSRGWLFRPVSLDRQLGASERTALLEAAVVAAFDWTDCAPCAAELQAAIVAWGRRHGVASEVSASAVSYRQEHRNAANAALAVALWEIVHDEGLLAEVVGGSPTSVWLQLPIPTVTTGRVAEHRRWGSMSGEVSADELTLIVGEVFERRDDDGSQMALAVEVFMSGRHRGLVAPEVAETLLWALGRGLAARGRWQVVELARWYMRTEPLGWTAVALSAWGAHVASLHLHDSLAWRLTRVAERQALELDPAGTEPRRHALIRYLVELVRSGVRVREADRWVEAERFGKAVPLLVEASQRLSAARTAFGEANPEQAHATEGLSLALRMVEVWLVAGRLRQRGHPVAGFESELDRAGRLLSQARELVGENRREGDDDDEILLERLDELDEAREREILVGLDDSPLA